MKLSKYLFGALALCAAVPAMADFVAPDRVDCKVTALEPQGANFFPPGGGSGPEVGDTIKLDISANEITDLTFASGRKILLKKSGAKLIKKTTGQEPYNTFFEGTFKSSTSDYIGVLHLEHSEKVSYGGFDLLRKEFFSTMKLHKLTFECTPAP